jgi:hypothetical protein
VLWIRITLMQIRMRIEIMLFTMMRIRILPFPLMQMRMLIWILPFTLMRIRVLLFTLMRIRIRIQLSKMTVQDPAADPNPQHWEKLLEPSSNRLEMLVTHTEYLTELGCE